MAVTTVLIFLAALAGSFSVLAQEPSQQPYIDRQLEEIRKQDARDAEDRPIEGGSYTENLRRKLETTDGEGSYIDELREKLPDQPGPENYTQGQKERLEPKAEESAIQAVHDGTSDLKLKRPGKIKGAFGFHFGAAVLSKNFQSSGVVAGRSYSETYTSQWDPNFTIHYEFQAVHSEIFGNFGLFIETGLLFNSGYGSSTGTLGRRSRYRTDRAPSSRPLRPISSSTRSPWCLGSTIGSTSPMYFGPTLGAGAGIVGMFEERTDAAAPNRAWTTVLQGSAGVSFLLDFLSRKNAWDAYADYGVKRSYLFAEARAWLPFAGDVSLSMIGVYAGYLGEF